MCVCVCVCVCVYVCFKAVVSLLNVLLDNTDTSFISAFSIRVPFKYSH